jgi:O-antigen/teichoic acid export membrane protein
LQVVQGIYPFLTLIPAILYPRLIDWAKEGPAVLFRRQLQLMLTFSLLLVPASLLAFATLPWIFPRVFGPEFAGGALPCAILLTSKGFVVINSLFTWGLWAQERDKSMLAITSAVAAASFVLNLIFIPRFGAVAASTVAGLSELGVLAGSMFLCWRHTRTTPAP